jgi:hypothetical protein
VGENGGRPSRSERHISAQGNYLSEERAQRIGGSAAPKEVDRRRPVMHQPKRTTSIRSTMRDTQLDRHTTHGTRQANDGPESVGLLIFSPADYAAGPCSGGHVVTFLSGRVIE